MNAAKKRARFEEAFLPHLNAAYNLARWLTGNSDVAEDLAQDAYLRAFRSFDSYQGRNDRAWLLTVVRNTCLTWLRENGRHPMAEFTDEMAGAADESPNAEAVLVNQAAIASLNDCLDALPVEFREAIVLRELEEMSYQEISDTLRVPVGTVMSRLARARKRLQQCLAGALR